MAKAKNLNVNFVANHEISHPKNNPLFKMIICEKKEGAADNFIFENAEKSESKKDYDILFCAVKLVCQALTRRKRNLRNERPRNGFYKGQYTRTTERKKFQSQSCTAWAFRKKCKPLRQQRIKKICRLF